MQCCPCSALWDIQGSQKRPCRPHSKAPFWSWPARRRPTRTAQPKRRGRPCRRPLPRARHRRSFPNLLKIASALEIQMPCAISIIENSLNRASRERKRRALISACETRGTGIECKYFTKAGGGGNVVFGVCLESDGFWEHAGTVLVACLHHTLVVSGGFQAHQAQSRGARVVLHRQPRAQLPPEHPVRTSRND